VKIGDKSSIQIQSIGTFEIFEGVTPAAIEWLIDHSEYRLYEDEEQIFLPNQQVDHMLLVVEGRYALRMQQGNEFKDLGEWGAGYTTGLLPFSRMKFSTAYGIALEPLKILALPSNCFTEMVNVSYAMVQNLVAVMSNRIKSFTELRLQDEKLMSLGKLSAGLAHELNNPASALVRGAEELYDKIHQTPERFKSVITMRVTPEETDALNEVLFTKTATISPKKELTLLQRESLKDDILDWLDDNGITQGDDIAETFLDADLSIADLEKMKAAVHGKDLEPIFWWVESTLSLEGLVKEIRESADRIGKLVKSVKSYTHMDQSQGWQATDLHEGIRSTLTMLKHALKEKNIHLVKDLATEMPLVVMHPGEINQVWTNLIDNALDAMQTGGVLTIHTSVQKGKAVVNIIDNGTGIPEEIRMKIFDPFFTTKAIGKGTGMGLEITRRIVLQHHGDIKVKSKPGETIFTVCIPLDRH
jgi:signal transduction histidine kinase